MANLQKISLKSIILGIAISIALFLLVRRSPYTLAVGPVITILLANPPTPKLGALYGILTGATVSIFLVLINAIPDWIVNNLALKLLETAVIVCFWASYGGLIVFIKRSWLKSRPWFF